MRIQIFSSVLLGLSVGATAWGQQQQYKQTNLVTSSTAAAEAPTVDPNIAGAWGLSESSTGPWWVADTETGLSTLYNGAGAIVPLVVTVPSANPSRSKTGTPTGVVFNANPSNFILSNGKAATFIFDTLDGAIAGWNGTVPKETSQIVVDRSKTSVYTGLGIAEAKVNGVTGTYLYAADARGGKVDVFDSKFKRATGIEEAIAKIARPSGYSPFNVQNVGGNLYVTLSRADQSTGPGQGYVAAITPEGKLLGVLQNGPFLNAPWGIAVAPGNFGKYSHDLLVGNNGDGQINAFNPITGQWIATLVDGNNKPIAIAGLWGMSFGNDTVNGGPATSLYYAADLDGKGGVYGAITPVQNTNGSNN